MSFVPLFSNDGKEVPPFGDVTNRYNSAVAGVKEPVSRTTFTAAALEAANRLPDTRIFPPNPPDYVMPPPEYCPPPPEYGFHGFARQDALLRTPGHHTPGRVKPCASANISMDKTPTPMKVRNAGFLSQSSRRLFSSLQQTPQSACKRHLAASNMDDGQTNPHDASLFSNKSEDGPLKFNFCGIPLAARHSPFQPRSAFTDMDSDTQCHHDPTALKSSPSHAKTIDDILGECGFPRQSSVSPFGVAVAPGGATEPLDHSTMSADDMIYPTILYDELDREDEEDEPYPQPPASHGHLSDAASRSLSHANNGTAQFSDLCDLFAPPQPSQQRQTATSRDHSPCAPQARPKNYNYRVRAAAGSLIAVSGRRVPVDKLHLLKTADETEARGPSTRRIPAEGVRHVSSRPLSPTSAHRNLAAVRHVDETQPSARPLPVAQATTVHRMSTHAPMNTMTGPGKQVRSCSSTDMIVGLRFPHGTFVYVHCNSPNAVAARVGHDVMNSLCISEPRLRIRVGYSYHAYIYSSASPAAGVAYGDLGVCVEISMASVFRGQVDGCVLRPVDVVHKSTDAAQLSRVVARQKCAIKEIERQVEFLSLSMEIRHVHLTFDGSVCFVRYFQTGHMDPTQLKRLSHTLQYNLGCEIVLEQATE